MPSFSNGVNPNSPRLGPLSNLPPSSNEGLQMIQVRPTTFDGSMEMTERERLLASLRRGKARRAAETEQYTRENFEGHEKSDEANEPEKIEDIEIIVNIIETEPVCEEANDVKIEEVRPSQNM
jgi:hypothetical protein